MARYGYTWGRAVSAQSLPAAAVSPSERGVADSVQAIAERLAQETRAPRYEVVVEELEQLIRGGVLAPGAAFPPEPEFAAALSIGRQTLRHALDQLEARGLVVRRRGIGTFVARRAIAQPLGQLSSYVITLSSDGQPPGTRLIGARLTVHPLASPFLTGNGEGLVSEISRLFSVQEEPVVFERIYLAPETADALPSEALPTAVIDDLLRERTGLDVDRGEERIRLHAVDREEAALLQLRPGEAVFQVTRLAFAGEIPVELRTSLIRGDRAELVIELRGSPLEEIRSVAVEGRSGRS